jgi:outer membrane immunogenic protein
VKKTLLAGVSLGAIALATGSQAADLPTRPAYKAPALAPAPWSWTGFYVGANIGAVRGQSSASDDPSQPSGIFWIGGASPGSVSADSTGVIGGLQAGYNWQFANLVLGVEGDISFSSLDRTVPVPTAPGGNDSYNSRLSALGTVRGRIGWAFDRLLLYGTGGAAFASLKDEYTASPIPLGFTVSPSSGRTGWAAGGGLEYAFTDHWTVRAEYLHVGFGDRTVTVAPCCSTAYAFVFKDSLDIGRVGINYKF